MGKEFQITACFKNQKGQVKLAFPLPGPDTPSEQTQLVCGGERLSRYCYQQQFIGLMASAGSRGGSRGVEKSSQKHFSLVTLQRHMVADTSIDLSCTLETIHLLHRLLSSLINETLILLLECVYEMMG